MKKLFNLCIFCLMAGTMFAQYVDLGLPSGTLWKSQNESGFYTYDEAMAKFGSQIPNRKKYRELIRACKWIWMGEGYKVIGPNNQYIVIPAAGYRGNYGDVGNIGEFGMYWSSAREDSGNAWYLSFDDFGADVDLNDCCYGMSVRLVK